MREEVKWFAKRMEAKLKENDHKGGWEDCDKMWLFQRLQEESRELLQALRSGTSDEIILEAVDVANFAMMIADITPSQGDSQ